MSVGLCFMITPKVMNGSIYKVFFCAFRPCARFTVHCDSLRAFPSRRKLTFSKSVKSKLL